MYKCVKDIGYQKMLGAGNNGWVVLDFRSNLSKMNSAHCVFVFSVFNWFFNY